MKKTLSIILSVLLAALFVASSLFAEAGQWPVEESDHGIQTATPNTATGKYYVDTAGKVDVLNLAPSVFTAPKYTEGLSNDTDTPRLTDGVYAHEPFDMYGISYFNKAWCNKDEQNGLEAAGPTIELTLTDGQTKKFFYTHEWKDLDCDVDSFRIWFNNETAWYDQTDFDYNWNQTDAEWAILVSQDGGKTYSVAYESTPLVLVTTGEGETATTEFKSSAAMLKSQGGEWIQYDVVDVNKPASTLFRYRTCGADFAQEYKNVTNIVYGCVYARRSNKGKADAFYYSSRISEFDVYGVNRNPITTEEIITEAPTEPAETELVTEAPKTDAPAPVTDAPKTDAPAPATDAPKTDAPATDAPAEKKGCGGSVALAGVAVIMTLGCAIISKKH